MSEKEMIKRLNNLLKDKISIEEIRTMSLLNEDDEMPYTLTIFERDALEQLLEKYKQEKEKNKELEEKRKTTMEVISANYIHKDKIIDILNLSKDEDTSTKKILSLLETLMSEVDRLEDIEDKKVQVEVQNIERKRDKYWKNKIKEKIEDLEATINEYYNSGIGIPISDEFQYKIDILQELLKEGE